MALTKLKQLDASNNPGISANGVIEFDERHLDAQTEFFGCGQKKANNAKVDLETNVQRQSGNRHIIFNQANKSSDQGISVQPESKTPGLS